MDLKIDKKCIKLDQSYFLAISLIKNITLVYSLNTQVKNLIDTILIKDSEPLVFFIIQFIFLEW